MSQFEQKPETKQIALSGFLSSITEYKKLIVTIDEPTFDKINSIALNYPGKKPIYKSAAGKCYLQLSLNKFEKVKIDNYVRMERKNIDFTANINQYEFVDSEGETVSGWNVILHKVKKVTKIEQPIEKPTTKVADQVSQIEQQLALNNKLLELSQAKSDNDDIDETI
jgi:hypothetical protein